MFLNIKKRKMGSALYLTIVIMALLLAIALGLSVIIVGQLVRVRGMGYSVIAFYSADAGIERTLKDSWSLGLAPSATSSATYEVSVYNPGDTGCPTDLFSINVNHCVKSVGIHRDVKRAIQVIY